MHARYYAPKWGRFLSVDPGVVNPSRPQTWNRYSYVFNQPVNFLDPTGAYRTDFHYDLTRIIAVAAGYSVADATAIAANTELPDHDQRKPDSVLNHDDRAAYHFPSTWRLSSMETDAKVTHDPYYVGTYLHALQDSYSHRGHGPLIGHIGPLLHGVAVDALFVAVTGAPTGAGAAGYQESYDVDTTSMRPGVALDAARATYYALVGLNGGNGKVPFSAIARSVYGYLAADEHSVLRKFYYDRLETQLGIR
jgi:hypothetical protein